MRAALSVHRKTITSCGDPSVSAERLAVLRERVRALQAPDILRIAFEEFSGRIAITSSFGAESVVLLHMTAQIEPTIPVLFLNTGKLFGETLRYRDRLQEMLGLTDIRAIGPHPDDLTAQDPEGDLWKRNPAACCHMRKTLPINRVLQSFDAHITGRKRFQTAQRAALETVELTNGRFRFNPLAVWGLDDLTAYIAAHKLPKHPLVADGYLSIGCMPCTRRVASDENYRDGRWAGREKTECGMHDGLNGDGI